MQIEARQLASWHARQPVTPPAHLQYIAQLLLIVAPLTING